MKYIYIVIMSTIPVHLHAQTAAPRRPLATSSSTRKSLLELREGIRQAQEVKPVIQPKTGHEAQ